MNWLPDDKRIWTLGGVLLAGFLLGGLVFGFTFQYMIERQVAEVSQVYLTRNLRATGANYQRPLAVSPETNFTEAAERVVNSVVYIATLSSGRFHEFGRGSGSGVIISPDGYIVTNNHVISGSAKVRVILNDKSEYDAEVLATDPNTDLAVLKINARALPAINFADSDGTRIGQWVLAVGNPFNLTSTVTAGIVSAKARNIGILRSELTSRYGVDYSIESFIQTDAAVNPGNSGGALVNLQGELIGINTAIATETGSYAGYSFAIPSNLVNKVVQDLIQYGTVQRGFIGVNIRDMTAGLADQYKLSLLQGALVTGLTPNGAAAEAGVQVGDLIVGVQARRIVSASELQEAVANFKPGDRVILKVMRKTDELNIEVTLLNLKGNTSLLTQKRTSIQDFGVIFTEPNNLELAKKQLDWGVKVSRVDESGLFDKAGVPVGFIITHVNKMPVKDIDELTLTLTRAELYAELNGILPNGKRKTFKIKIP